MDPKQRWLDEGLAVLADQGHAALRIDRLAERLAMTKGSFYHHFGGMAGYKHELLGQFEELCTRRYINEVESVSGLDALAKLERLQTLILEDPHDYGALEVAVRAWAMHDPEVHDAQRRVDATRIDYLRELCRGAGVPSRRALDLSRLMYTVLIGSGHIIPPLAKTDIRRLWKLALATFPETATR